MGISHSHVLTHSFHLCRLPKSLAFSSLPHLTFLISQPCSVSMPPALKLVLTFHRLWQQCLASPLNTSRTFTGEPLPFLSLLLFRSLNPFCWRKRRTPPPPIFPPTCRQIHAKAVERKGLQGCCLDSFIWYLRDHRAEIKRCQHVTVPQHVSKTTDLGTSAAGSLEGQSKHLMHAQTDTETQLHN